MTAPTLSSLITHKRAEITSRTAKYNLNTDEHAELRTQGAPDVARIDQIRNEQARLTAELATLQGALGNLERELADDEQVARDQAQSTPTGVRVGAYDSSARGALEPSGRLGARGR